MREYSMPALAEVPASANLADVVGRRAAEQPLAVMLRRKDGAGGWRDVTAEQFSDEVRALARGLIAADVAAGDRVAIMSHTRYEWTLLDYALWSVGAVVVPIYETSSAEQAEWILSDSAARAVIVETEAFDADDLGRPRPAARARARLAAAGGPGQADRRQLRRQRRDRRRAGDRGRRGRSGHDHLHLGHHRAAQGVRAHPREPAQRRPQRVHGAAGRHRRRRSTRRRCCSCRSRTCSRGSSRSAAWRPGIVLGHCADMGNLLPELASFQPTFVLAVPRVFEKVYNGAESKAEADGKGKIFARAAATAVAYSEALDSGPAPRSGCGPSTPSSTGWSTTSCGPPWAGGPTWRFPAGRRSRRGSGTSSAGSASPSSRATG